MFSNFLRSSCKILHKSTTISRHDHNDIYWHTTLRRSGFKSDRRFTLAAVIIFMFPSSFSCIVGITYLSLLMPQRPYIFARYTFYNYGRIKCRVIAGSESICEAGVCLQIFPCSLISWSALMGDAHLEFCTKEGWARKCLVENFTFIDIQ